MTETAAGRMARTMPELGNRELGALLCENQHRELCASAPGSVTAAWVLGWMASAERAVRDRAEDALALGYAKAHHGAGSDAYWAALP